MPKLGISAAFARYGASLKNPQWSVSAWAPNANLVVSLWNHHYRRGPSNTMEFADSVERWTGPGNKEFRRNIEKAFRNRIPVSLVVVSTVETERVQAGEDASRIPKDFDSREDLIGEVIFYNGIEYVIQFRKVGKL